MVYQMVDHHLGVLVVVRRQQHGIVAIVHLPMHHR